MPSPDPVTPGYFQRVLTGGARPMAARTGIHRLLGAGSGECQRRADYLLPNFVYARANVVEGEPSADFVVPASPAAVDALPPEHAPMVEFALPDAREWRRVEAATAPVATSPALPPQHAQGAPVETGRAEPAVTAAAREPRTRPMPAPVPAEAAAMRGESVDLPWRERPGSRAPAVATEAVTRHARPSRGEAQENAIDAAALPPALQKLAPHLGRLRMAPASIDEAPAAVTAPMSADDHRAPRTEPAAPTLMQAPTAPVAAPPVEPLVRSAAHRPVPRLENGTMASTLARLQQTNRLLTRALGEAQASAVERATEPAPSPAPARVEERVVIQEVSEERRSPRAFWERRYLGRPHMRAVR